MGRQRDLAGAGRGRLLAAFSKVYAVLLSALYLTVLLLVVALLFRGVVFEGAAFAPTVEHGVWVGLAAGRIRAGGLGALVQGLPVKADRYVGGASGWFGSFPMLIGAAAVFGYALLGTSG